MTARSSGRGGILLEVMVALSILLMSAMTIGGIVIDSISGMVRTRRTMQACDLARSTMAEIEAGLVDPSAIGGAITRWDSSRLLMEQEAAPLPADGAPADELLGGGGAGPVGEFGDDAEELWSVEIETEPTEASGLHLVTVTAWLARAVAPEEREASYTLRQVVRLGSEAEDVAGEEDELMDAARRGLGTGGGGP